MLMAGKMKNEFFSMSGLAAHLKLHIQEAHGARKAVKKSMH
jgi:hypothetical protein